MPRPVHLKPTPPEFLLPTAAPLRPEYGDAADPIDEDGRQLQEALGIVRRYWGWVLGLTLLGVLAAATYAWLSRPVYEASATLLIESDRNKVINLQDVYAGATPGRENFETQVVLVDSPAVEMRAIRALQLWEHEEFDPRRPGTLTRLLDRVRGAPTPQSVPGEEPLVQAILPQFHADVSVVPLLGSQLVEVRFAAHDPALAARAARVIADSYIENDRDSRFEVSQQASQWLQAKIGALRRRLDDSTNALQAYRDAHGLVKVDGATQGEDSEALHSLASELVTARLRRVQAETVYNDLRRVENGDYSTVAAVVTQPAVQEAKSRVVQAELKLSELGQRFGAGNSRIIEASAALEAAREAWRRQMANVAASLTHEYQSAAAAERAMQDSMSHARSALQKDSKAEDQLKVLERDVQTNRDLYEMFVSRVKETDISSTLRQDVARVITQPILPSTPIRPNRAKIMLLGLGLGLTLGLALAYLLARLDNTLKVARDVEAQLGLTVLSSVPHCTEVRPGEMGRAVLDRPDSQFAEMVRSARTAVLLSNLDLPQRVILLTSALPDEGKTTMAANLALAHAQSGKTLLIEGDLRRPRLQDMLDLRHSNRGLTDVMSGSRTVMSCLHAVPDSPLMVLPCGVAPPNPGEVLLSQRFRDMLEELATRFDVIVIDSPPLELVSDALILASMATDVVHVVRSARTQVPIARRALRKLRQVRAPLLGVIVNDLDLGVASAYYGEPRLASASYLARAADIPAADRPLGAPQPAPAPNTAPAPADAIQAAETH